MYFYNMEKYDKVITIYQNYLKNKKSDFLLERISLIAAKSAFALQQFEKCLNYLSDIENEESYLYRAKCYLALGKYDKAKNCLKPILEHKEGKFYPSALIVLLNICEKEKNMPEYVNALVSYANLKCNHSDYSNSIVFKVCFLDFYRVFMKYESQFLENKKILTQYLSTVLCCKKLDGDDMFFFFLNRLVSYYKTEKEKKELKKVIVNLYNSNNYKTLYLKYFYILFIADERPLEAEKKLEKIIPDLLSKNISSAGWLYLNLIMKNNNFEKLDFFIKDVFPLLDKIEKYSLDYSNYTKKLELLFDLCAFLGRYEDAIFFYKKRMEYVDKYPVGCNFYKKYLILYLAYDIPLPRDMNDILCKTVFCAMKNKNEEERALTFAILNYFLDKMNKKEIENFLSSLMKKLLNKKVKIYTYPEIIELYTNINLKLKRYDECLSLLDKSIKFFAGKKDEEKFKILKGYVLYKKKDYKQAKNILLQLINNKTKDPYAYNNLACLLAEENDFKTALKYAKIAYNLLPEDKAILDTIGWVYFKLNNIKEAEKYLSLAGEKLKAFLKNKMYMQEDLEIVNHLIEFYSYTKQKEKFEFWKEIKSKYFKNY